MIVLKQLPRMKPKIYKGVRSKTEYPIALGQNQEDSQK